MGWRAGGEKKLMEATNMFQLPSTRRRKRSNLSAASLHIKLHFFSNTPVLFPFQAWNKQTQEYTWAPKWSTNTNPKPVSLSVSGFWNRDTSTTFVLSKSPKITVISDASTFSVSRYYFKPLSDLDQVWCEPHYIWAANFVMHCSEIR